MPQNVKIIRRFVLRQYVKPSNFPIGIPVEFLMQSAFATEEVRKYHQHSLLFNIFTRKVDDIRIFRII